MIAERIDHLLNLRCLTLWDRRLWGYDARSTQERHEPVQPSLMPGPA